MDAALEAMRKAPVVASAEAWANGGKMFENTPEQRLRHLGATFPVRGGQAIAAGRRGTANGGEFALVVAQRVANVVESGRMRQLGVQQRNHMTPGRIGAPFLLDAVPARQLGDQMAGDERTDLMQRAKLEASRVRGHGYIPHRGSSAVDLTENIGHGLADFYHFLRDDSDENNINP